MLSLAYVFAGRAEAKEISYLRFCGGLGLGFDGSFGLLERDTSLWQGLAGISTAEYCGK
jgi:hypothetical protein